MLVNTELRFSRLTVRDLSGDPEAHYDTEHRDAPKMAPTTTMAAVTSLCSPLTFAASTSGALVSSAGAAILRDAGR
jgi:hypothetical protein